ncbi:hypothetical protein ISCGN_016411 [Ixodes scapularis]
MKILRAEWQRQARVYRDLLRAVLCDSNQGNQDNHRLREFFNIVERNTEFLWRLTLQKLRASLPKRQPVARGKVQSPLGIRRGSIGFSQTTGKREDVERGFQRLGRIAGVIGCVDGTMIAIVGPSQNDPTVTKAAYWCRKQFYALNAMEVCNADCRVMSIEPRYPGSVYNSFAWRYSWLRSNFEQGRLIDDGRLLLGDSGYALEPWLITPVPGFHATSTACGRFNKAHSSIRSIVERCIGLLKSRFQYLQRHRTLYYHPTTATVIISSCAVHHNMCLSSREAEPDPHEPGLESGPSSEGSEPATAVPQRSPTQATMGVAPTRDTIGDREPLIVLATVALPHARDVTRDSAPLVVLTSTDALATREAPRGSMCLTCCSTVKAVHKLHSVNSDAFRRSSHNHRITFTDM